MCFLLTELSAVLALRNGIFTTQILSPRPIISKKQGRLNNFLQRPISLWFWIVSNPIRVVD